MLHTFSARLWLWDARKSDAWTFVTLPTELSDELRARTRPRKGFGSVPVEVTVGDSTWRTSIFPDKASGSFLLPVKAAIRKAEALSVGDTLEISLLCSDD